MLGHVSRTESSRLKTDGAVRIRIGAICNILVTGPFLARYHFVVFHETREDRGREYVIV